MAMPVLRRQWTVDDLEDLPNDGNRYEIIDGQLYVTPAPGLSHQAAVGELFRLLADYLEREPIGFAFVAPGDVVFSPRRAIQPDVFVLPAVDGRRPESWRAAGKPLLAVEVLSPSTARADRVAKRTLLREERVAEYWIVDLDSRLIERSTPDEARPELVDSALTWRPTGAAVPLIIDVAAYFAKVLDR